MKIQCRSLFTKVFRQFETNDKCYAVYSLLKFSCQTYGQQRLKSSIDRKWPFESHFTILFTANFFLLQAVKSYVSESAQTEWRFPTNATTQYVPREFDEETKKIHLTSEELCQMAEAVAPRFDLGLQHNEVLNAFTDDWGNLAVEETTFGSKSDSYLKVKSAESKLISRKVLNLLLIFLC